MKDKILKNLIFSVVFVLTIISNVILGYLPKSKASCDFRDVNAAINLASYW